MKLCACSRPQRDPDARDRLRCGACRGYTPTGSPLSRVDFTRESNLALSLLTNATTEYQWLEGQLYGLQRHGEGVGRISGPANPTLALAGSEPHQRGRSYAALASRLLKRVVVELRNVDDAVGEARYAVDIGPPVKVDYVARDVACPHCHGVGRVGVVPSDRADLVEAHAAKGRRRARGEGVPR